MFYKSSDSGMAPRTGAGLVKIRGIGKNPPAGRPAGAFLHPHPHPRVSGARGCDNIYNKNAQIHQFK